MDSIIASVIKPASKQDVVVLLGLSDIIDVQKYSENMVDVKTFGIDGDDNVFDEEDWFGRVFMSLRRKGGFHLMSYQQYVYYTSYAPNLTKFKERVVIVYDNVRSLFPIRSDLFIEKAGLENIIEERPESMPLYQAEQVSIGGKTYCSYITPTDCRMLSFFRDSSPVQASMEKCDDILEIDEHMYALDDFLNRALLDSRKNAYWVLLSRRVSFVPEN